MYAGIDPHENDTEREPQKWDRFIFTQHKNGSNPGLIKEKKGKKENQQLPFFLWGAR